MALKPFKCELNECHKTFKTNYELRKHSLIDLNIKPFACVWPQCERWFGQNASLKIDQLIEVWFVSWNHFNDCNQIFTQKCNLKTHSLIHSQIKAFICNYNECKQKFSHKWSLNKHMQTFKCNYNKCENSFVTNYELKQDIHKKYNNCL